MQHIIRVLSVNTAYLQIIAVYLCFAFTLSYLEGVLPNDNGKGAFGFSIKGYTQSGVK